MCQIDLSERLVSRKRPTLGSLQNFFFTLEWLSVFFYLNGSSTTHPDSLLHIASESVKRNNKCNGCINKQTAVDLTFLTIAIKN